MTAVDNQVHVSPPTTEFDIVEHITDGGFCPCLPSVHEVLSDDLDRTVGYVVRHHRYGIAEALPRDALPAGLARLLR